MFQLNTWGGRFYLAGTIEEIVLKSKILSNDCVSCWDNAPTKIIHFPSGDECDALGIYGLWKDFGLI